MKKENFTMKPRILFLNPICLRPDVDYGAWFEIMRRWNPGIGLNGCLAVEWPSPEIVETALGFYWNIELLA